MKHLVILISFLLLHSLSQAQCPDASLIMNLSTPRNIICNTDHLAPINLYGCLSTGGTQLVYPGSHSIFTWSTDGKGTFTTPVNNGINSVLYYNVSPQDYQTGIVTINLHTVMDPESAAFYHCNSDYDGTYILLLMKYTINAGVDQSFCTNAGNIVAPLNAQVTSDNFVYMGFTTQWESLGSGTFQDATKMNTTYSPSSTDLSNGSVKLIAKIRKNQCDIHDFVADTLKLSFGTCMASEQAQATETLSIFPNPAHDELMITTGFSDEKKTLFLFNASGTTVYQNDFYKEQKIPISLPPGIYQALLIDGNKTLSKKIIIE